MARDDLGIAELLTHRLPLEQVAAAYQMARAGTDGALKVAIDLRASASR